MTDRMIATDGERYHSCMHQPRNGAEYVLMAKRQVEPAAKGNITYVSHSQLLHRCTFERIVVRPYPLYAAQRSWSETGAVSVCDCEIHRDTDKCDLKVLE